MVKYDGAVYLDSPIASALRQVAPFYTQGAFSGDRTPLLMRRRPASAYGLLMPRGGSQMNLKMVGAGESKRLPVKKGGAIFYNFNSQGNIHTVANRSYRHILVLHGESNKRASARPAARLYDYICVAGDIAAERYVSSGIFRRSEVEDGRILKMGDTFVQDLDNCLADPEAGDTLLYAPTWEGYGGAINNYSSLSSFGPEAVLDALRITGLRKVLIRPHPYLGLLSPKMISAFWDAMMAISKVAELRLDLASANALTKAAGRMAALASGGRVAVSRGDDRVALCLCDVSAMESVCLKAGLPHFVLLRNFTTPENVASIYAVKSAADPVEFRTRFPRYMAAHPIHDAEHHARTFGYSHAEFRDLPPGERVAGLMAIAAENRVWQAQLQQKA